MHRRGAKRSGTKLRRRHVDVACGKLGAGKSVLEVAQDAPVAAGQIEDIRKGLDSPGQHGNFDAMQGRLSDSEIVTWIALPHPVVRGDLIVYGLTGRIGRRNSLCHGIGKRYRTTGKMT